MSTVQCKTPYYYATHSGFILSTVLPWSCQHTTAGHTIGTAHLYWTATLGFSEYTDLWVVSTHHWWVHTMAVFLSTKTLELSAITTAGHTLWVLPEHVRLVVICPWIPRAAPLTLYELVGRLWVVRTFLMPPKVSLHRKLLATYRTHVQLPRFKPGL